MKDLSHILKECSIKDIYYGNSGTATTYKIPIYQRNYAWERDEIFALFIKTIFLEEEQIVAVYSVFFFIYFSAGASAFKHSSIIYVSD